MKHIVLYTSLLLLSITANAQSTKDIPFTKEFFPNQKEQLREAKEQLELADDFFESEQPGKYKYALDGYLKAGALNPNNAKVNLRTGICYLNSPFKMKCTPYFIKAYELNPNIDPKIRYYLGRAYHLNMEWDKAIGEYKAYKSSLSVKNSDPSIIKDVDKKILECGYGIDLVKSPVRVFIDNIGQAINTPYPDYGPVISADEDILMFTSRRNTTTGGGVDESLDEFFEDIYVSYRFNDTWTPPKNIGTPINTNGHDATVNLSPDGQKLLTYRDDKGSGNIYLSDNLGDAWTLPDKMPKAINSSAHESSASFTFDGRTIFFVSEREEGSMGKRDIFSCTKNAKGKWETAVNIGPAINTEYNEESVFVVPDGKTMYFSSEAHSSMGGYDIFKSVYENGQWSKPQNLGYPINTPDDDVFLVVAASGKRGYYASVRPDGFGGRDIYVITFLGPEKPVALDTEDPLIASLEKPIKEVSVASSVEIKENQVTLLKGVVTDALTKQPLEAELTLIDNVKNLEIATFTSNAKTGKFLVALPSGVNYGIAVKKENYLFHSENFDIPSGADYQEVNKDIQLQNIAVGNKIVLKNIFFDFDKATLRPESTSELERLQKLLTDVPTLKIEISGHTDNKGSAMYNQTLSENRAKAVVEFLISKGIAKERLEFKGYGLSQPIANNETDEGRQLNRRTEFKILKR